MTTREADARAEVDEFTQPEVVKPTAIEAAPGGTAFYTRQGEYLGSKNVPHVVAPELSPREQTDAAEALRGALEAGQVKYPTLANHLLKNPEKLWLMGEIQMMLSPEPSEVSYDFTAELMEGLTTTTGQREDYEFHTSHDETQQMFWNEVGVNYEGNEREFLLDTLSMLSPEGANKIGARAVLWADSHGVEDEETRLQLFLNIVNWSAAEQEFERGQEGIFGGLEALQEQVEQHIITPLVNAGVGLIHGAEEAARRRALTPGEQAAFAFGLRPPEESGEFGWWRFVSGGVDALTEIGGDPLAWVAGVGLGTKAAKTIPVAIKATKAGRVTAALRSILPKPLAGVSAKVGGGRFARVTYALTQRNIDDLLKHTLKSGVAEDALGLIKAGNMSKFERLYPAWRGISDTAQSVIRNSVESPDEFIEVLKADALNEVLAGGEKLDDLTRAAQMSEEAMRREGVGALDESIIENVLNRWASDTGNVQLKAELSKVLKGTPTGGALTDDANDLIRFFKDEASPAQKLYRVGTANADTVDNLTVGDKIEFAMESAANRRGSFWQENTRLADRSLRKIAYEINDAPALRNPANTAEAEHLFSGRFKISAIEPDGRKGIVVLDYVDDILPEVKGTFSNLLADQNIPHALRIQAAIDNLRLRTYNVKSGQAFILSEVPLRSKKVFTWDNFINIKGTGRLATGVRRTVARITPGRIPNEINLFNTRKGIDDLRRLGEHFGLEQSTIDDLVGSFAELDLGGRQEWVWDTFMRTIGKETGVPAFEHQLVQFYRGAGVRNFSASAVDLLDDGKRIPMLPSQMTSTMPVPVEELTQVFRRARNIGSRSRAARTFRFNGRGLGKTNERRRKLVRSIRTQLGDQADDLSDDQLYDMAFSLVSPNADMDARGLIAGKMMPAAGTVFNQFHHFFTKAMLVFRPIQWMWRVALLEEPIRAHIFNMPSLYSNPLQYMRRAREAHYINNVRRWAQTNMAWGQDVLHTLTKGSKDDILKRLDGLGLTDEIFETVPKTSSGVRNGVEGFITDALYHRTRPSRLNPIKRVPWAVRSRARNIKTAERALKKLDLPLDFNFADEAQEIAGRLVSGYLGESVGASQRKLYQWSSSMSEAESYTHGRVWGAKMIEFTEDAYGRAALRRYAALLRGETPDVNGITLVNHSNWELMAPDLHLKYPNIDDEIELAERYLDDMLSQEIDVLFRPFINELDADELANLLDEFADTRKIQTTVGGVEVDWDMRGANYGGGVNGVGEFTRDVRKNVGVEIPNDLPAPSFDPRFLAEDDRKFPTRMADWVLQTFGEEATQTINRRPAWLHTYKRQYDQLTSIGVPAERAQRLATDQANRMVNYVFFNMDEAPYYIARLNRKLPFFGATYEVVGTWSYKMPVAVGGTWQAGVGETARKFDRLIDGLVNIGVLDREVDDQGDTSIVLNLVPPDSQAASNNELGRMLQGAGFNIVNTLDQAVSTILGMEEGLGIRSQGYRLAAGHPLNPTDYGVLSFAQADVGLNPLTNIAVTALAATIPGAGAPRREAVRAGETLADVADRLNVDWQELVRWNRDLFVHQEDFGSGDLYLGLLKGEIDPEALTLPLSTMSMPQSSLWDAMSDAFMPFGQINSPHEFGANFIPSTFRWALAGLALQNQPTDEFWKDSDLRGVFGGVLPPINEAQVASQLNEAFMYVQAHNLVNGKGPFTRIQEEEAALQELIGSAPQEEIDQRRAILDEDIKDFLDTVWKTAAESLILRGLTGSMMPTTPGHVRTELETIRDFWDTKEYADGIVAGDAERRLRNFGSMEEVEQYQEQLAAWLLDPTADRARATFIKNNPQLTAYLTPKTFYKEPVPEITSYEEYQRQIETGEREPSPLHVTMWRARSSAIQADYYNKFIAAFGNDPTEAAATALQNRDIYSELNEERNIAYDGLEMWDDMHGGVYNTWREENFGNEGSWTQDQINDTLQTVRSNLSILFELEDYTDIQLDLEGIQNLNSGIRGAIAEISNAIRQYEELTDEEEGTRNPYETAIHRYFKEAYIPYVEQISDLYDLLPEVADTERESLIYERIKFTKNQFANADIYFDGDTSTPFPNPLEYQWQGKDDDEREIKLQQWVTRPIEWMDQDQSLRIVQANPAMSDYLPTSNEDFDLYRLYTLEKIKVDEAFEADEITRTVRNKAMENLEKQLRDKLAAAGRGGEIRLMDMTPYEKLELANMLPPYLANMPVGNGILGDAVRYYKQALATAEESPGTQQGRKMVAPLYDVVERAFYTDTTMRDTLQDLGINLQDESALDAFLPYLFFGYTGER